MSSILLKLIPRLRIAEGWSAKAYLDTTGNVTIGYGHNLGKPILTDLQGNPVSLPPGTKFGFIPAVPISMEVGERILLEDSLEHLADLRARIPWFEQLDSVRQQVVADMAFNMGVEGLVGGWPNFMRQVREGRFEDAARNMEGTPWRRQVKSRAVRLIRMMRTGQEE